MAIGQIQGASVKPYTSGMIESNIDPTWGIECLIRGHRYTCRICGSRPARLVVRLWEDGLRTRVPLCDDHLKVSIAAFKKNTLDAASAASNLPKSAPPARDVLFDLTAIGRRIELACHAISRPNRRTVVVITVNYTILVLHKQRR